MRTKELIRFLSRLAIATLFLSAVLAAQSDVTGDITGTVTDQSGAFIANASIQIKGQEGNVQTAETSQSGAYRLSLLKPGSYLLTATAAGMKTVTRTVEVKVGQVTQISLSLPVGSPTETVEVTAAAPLVSSDSPDLATTFSSKQIEQLPSPGGDITNVAEITPGVITNTGTGYGYGNYTAFGLPSTSNLLTVDGNDDNDPFLNLNNTGASNLALGGNAIEQTAVLTNAYSAQYGRQAGVLVQSTTKSGTNSYHGNILYNWNGDVLNANDWFNKHVLPGQAVTPRPFAVNNQWAGAFGGPIRHNKTFFFVDFEGLRYALPNTTALTIPTPQFQAAVLANITANSPSQLAIYNQIFSLYNKAPGVGNAVAVTPGIDPNLGCADFSGTAGFGPGGTACAATVSANGVNHNKEWLLSARIDQNISGADRIFGRYHMDRGSQPSLTDSISNPLFGISSIQPTYDGEINETHVFNSKLVNQLEVSGLWYSAIFNPNSPAATREAALPYGTVAFTNGILFTALGGSNSGYPTAFFPNGRNVTQYGLVEDLSYSAGSHSLRFGANFRRDDITDYDQSSYQQGFLTMFSLNDFYNGQIQGSLGDNYLQWFTAHPTSPIALYNLGVYAQDEWRAGPKLKLTLGVRADHTSNPICQANCFARLTAPFTEISHNQDIPYNQVITSNQHQAFSGLSRIDIQPRFGVAWSPLGNDSLVLRGGVGLFTDLYQATIVDNMAGNAPNLRQFALGGAAFNAPFSLGSSNNAAQQAQAADASFATGFSSGQTVGQIEASNPFFTPFGFTSIPRTVLNPKYLKWNLEVQKALGNRTALSVNYVGTHGYDLLLQDSGLNAFSDPANGPYLAPLPTSIPDGRFGTIAQFTNNGRSNYNGLLATVTRGLGYGFQGSFTYQWSHALDTLTSTNPGTPFNVYTSLLYQPDPFNPNHGYGNSDSDVRHSIAASFLWELPYRFGNRFENAALGGWAISSTIFAHTGTPYSAFDLAENISNSTIAGAPLAILASAAPGVIPTSSACSSPGPAANPSSCVNPSQFVAPGQETTLGNVERNAFRGPSYFNANMSLVKNFQVAEHVKFGLGANFYNVFNHPNFANPYGGLFSSAFGHIFAEASAPTNPYGAFPSGALDVRLVQLTGKFEF